MSESPEIRGFFDDQTNTITYLVWDPGSRQAAVIDPVLDYDPIDGTVDTRSAERVLGAAEELGLTISHVLETHARALLHSEQLQRSVPLSRSRSTS